MSKMHAHDLVFCYLYGHTSQRLVEVVEPRILEGVALLEEKGLVEAWALYEVRPLH